MKGKGLLFFVLFCSILSAVHAQENLWKDVAESRIAAEASQRKIIPKRYRSIELDTAGFLRFAKFVPKEFSQAARLKPVFLTIPMPYGGFQKFAVVETEVMEPGLAAKFPEIKVFGGRGVDDPTATIKIDWTPRGFHAQVLSPVNGAVYIDPYANGNLLHYISYYKKDLTPRGFTEENNPIENDKILLDNGTQAFNGCVGETLRRYRLAVACTGEYAAAVGATTVSQALAAIATSVNRVNGVYETEIAVRMVLVNNNNMIVFLNPNTDPYSNNSSSTLITQNQTTCDANIGTANYDIGHVFTTGGGGLAGLGVVCNASRKALGETGLPNPTGDAYDIDFVAHEMGHQFGGNHTFNATTGSCSGNRSSLANAEPGSGTTIMAYAGICLANDLQPHSDPYFHPVSYNEITNYTINSTGNTCAVQIATNNTSPVVNAGSDYTIPKSTPFILTGSGSDPDGNNLVFAWDEVDVGGPAGNANTPTGNAPLFRFFPPVPSPVRYFPKISDVINNTSTIGEVLPNYGRTINFRFTARDNRAGVCWDQNLITVDANSGPFVVTAPNTAVTYTAGTTVNITWDVANTNIAPVNCSNVAIELSVDGGLTFPITLLSTTSNDGNENVIIPNNPGTTARVRVRALGNVFYDMSNTNFTIQQPLPNLTINDVTLNEGNSGTTSFTFAVSLSAPAPSGGVTFDIATANNTAIAPGDFTAQSLSAQTIPAGSSTYSFTVSVNGDATVEPNETFFVNVSNVTGANVTKSQGQGTIGNDDIAPLPNLTINDVSINEGNAGTTSFTFTVGLSAPAPSGGVTFDIATANNTAIAPGDFTAQSLSAQTIPAGSSTYSFTVSVNGDATVEPNETFFVNVSNVTGANVTKSQGQGTIGNDDIAPLPNLTINDVSINEGNAGTTSFTFTVGLSAPAPSGGVTFDIATANNTAIAPGDFTAQSLSAQTIPAGSSTYSFTVLVNGDATVEPNETFFVNVSSVTGANVTKSQGVGTITNDDDADPCTTDATPPVITPKNATVYLNANGQVTVQPSDVATVTDNCTVSSVTVSPNTFNCSNISSTGVPGSDQQAYRSTTSMGNQDFYGELGLAFRVSDPNGIVIKQLGAFDHQGNGITGTQTGSSIRVAIFNKTTQTIVSGLDANISGNGDQYVSNFRLKNISPVTLPAGEYVVVAKGFSSAELNGNFYYNGSPYPAGDNGSGAITFLSTTYYGQNDPAGFSFPVFTASLGTTNAYLAGTFVFTTASPVANTVTITAMDAKGNTSMSTAQVTVMDNFPPTITPKNTTVFLNQNGTATIQPSDVIQSVTDNCSVDQNSYTVSPNTFNCSNVSPGGGAGTNYQAYSSNTATGNQVFAGELGLEFTVNAPGGVVINQLGAFDHQGNGINGSGIRVAVFRKSNQTIVSGLDVVIVGNADYYSANYRLKNIAPVTLPPGTYVLVAKGYNNNELNGNAFYNGASYPAGNNGSNALTFGPTAYYGDNTVAGFNYPIYSGDFGFSTTYLAGTFVYSTMQGSPAGTTVTITAKDSRGNIGSTTATVTVSDPLGTCNAPAMLTGRSVTTSAQPLLAGKAAPALATIRVFPNPGNGVFTVELFDPTASMATLQIINENGKVLEVKSVHPAGKTASLTVPFNLAHQPAGMYLVKVISNNGISTSRVIIQH